MAVWPGKESDLRTDSNGKWTCRVHTTMRCGVNVSAMAKHPYPDTASKKAHASFDTKVAKHRKTCQKGCS